MKEKKNENKNIEPILILNPILPSGHHALLPCAVFVEDAVCLELYFKIQLRWGGDN